MQIINLLNIFLFVVSVGAFSKERERYPEWNLVPKWLDGLANIVLIISIIIEVKLLHEINGFSWYWNLLISLMLFVISTYIHTLYALFFGYKIIDKRISATKKVNIYLMDAYIAFFLGLIIYFT